MSDVSFFSGELLVENEVPGNEHTNTIPHIYQTANVSKRESDKEIEIKNQLSSTCKELCASSVAIIIPGRQPNVDGSSGQEGIRNSR